MTELESLHPGTWLARLERLNEAIGDLEATAADTLIRQAYHVGKLTPAPLRDVFQTDLSEERLEDLLEAEAHETLVFQLIKHPLALSLSRDLGSHMFKAVVAIDSEEVCGSGEHHSVAKAAFSAWARCLVKMADESRS